MDGITKIYPNGFVANRQVTLDCREGEIHALLGENGAGKTTLMKVLFGLEKPDEGRIVLRGREVAFGGPLDALKHGVGMVHQHFMLVDELTVAENLVLGEEPTSRLLFDMKQAQKITRDLAEKYHFKLDPKALVGDCTVGVKQIVEILKALLRGAEILIMDEPTAVLTPQETLELFEELGKLRELGHTIIFISHKLDEVKALCDRFTILRGGRTVQAGNVADYTKQELSNLMVGRDVTLSIRKEPPACEGKPVVRVEHLSYTNSEGKALLGDVSFAMREGHILGVAGVEGNGQNELGEIMTGLRSFKRGRVSVNGQSIQGRSVREIREAGVSIISEDRMAYGCAAGMSIRDNIIADRYYKVAYSKGIRLNFKQIRQDVDEFIRRFGIACPSPESPAGVLSGGNMQKMIVAREFTSGANVIIANQPTRGIDVGSTEFIRKQLVRLSRERRVSVLLISADLREILEVSDSILVLHGGELTAYFDSAADVSELELGEYMLGVRKMPPEQLRRACHEAS